MVSGYFKTYSADILVNNTNGPAPGAVLEKSISDYQSAFDTLFKTVVFLTSAALPSMKKNGFGRIINISSLSIRQPHPPSRPLEHHPPCCFRLGQRASRPEVAPIRHHRQQHPHRLFRHRADQRDLLKARPHSSASRWTSTRPGWQRMCRYAGLENLRNTGTWPRFYHRITRPI
ncbi:MAG: SDR family NAD(P)-dependent oxidoreductase [Desulfobacterales bacterium]|nr:SDR family NAD(P)-dependent oxidoreductase [Desulfobacterales bacterium]